jgi:hypothetical protein
MILDEGDLWQPLLKPVEEPMREVIETYINARSFPQVVSDLGDLVCLGEDFHQATLSLIFYYIGVKS